jgi:hypothetical protein
MFEIIRHSKRVYRSNSNIAAGIVTLVVAGAFIVSAIAQEPGNLSLVAVAITIGLIGAVVCARLIWAGIFVLEDRVHVANIFSSFDIDPSEIDGIEIARWKLIPRTCVIRTHDGQVRPAFGLQESTNFPNGSAERLIDELRQELGGRVSGSQGMQAV